MMWDFAKQIIAMTTDQDAQKSKKQVIELLAVANEYCMFIEKSYDYSKEDILQYIHRIGPLLYLKGSLLPELHPENPEATERYVTEEVWENIFNELRNAFGRDDEFWFIDEATFQGDEITKGSLAELVTDIYQDLKDFVFLYSKNSADAIINSIAECRQLYHHNWGPKLTRVQKHVHSLVYPPEAKDEYEDLG
jgi:hypothetical protein